MLLAEPNTPEYNNYVQTFAKDVVAEVKLLLSTDERADEWISSVKALQELGYVQTYGRVLKCLRESGAIEYRAITKRNILYSLKSIKNYKLKK